MKLGLKSIGLFVALAIAASAAACGPAATPNTPEATPGTDSTPTNSGTAPAKPTDTPVTSPTVVPSTQTTPSPPPSASPGAGPMASAPRAVPFILELHAGGETFVAGKKVANDDAILPIAREAQAKDADLRAVIRADQAVQYGRVVHAFDLLKQAGVSRIAFAVSLVPPEAGGKAAGGTPAGSPASATMPILGYP